VYLEAEKCRGFQRSEEIGADSLHIDQGYVLLDFGRGEKF
jgi:hypothetical protein